MMRINEGDAMEIFTDRDGQVVLKKYSPIRETDSFAAEYTESLGRVTGLDVLLIDNENIISVSGALDKELVGSTISLNLYQAVQEGKLKKTNRRKGYVKITDETFPQYTYQIIKPISCGGVVDGAIILLSMEEMGEKEVSLLECAADFLGNINDMN